jgi:hypothetical protein
VLVKINEGFYVNTDQIDSVNISTGTKIVLKLKSGSEYELDGRDGETPEQSLESLVGRINQTSSR